MPARSLSLVSSLLLCFLFAGPAIAGDQFTGVGAEGVQLEDKAKAARKFDPFSLVWLIGPTDDPSGETKVRCIVETDREGDGRKGVKVTFDPTFLNAGDGTVLTDPDPVEVTTDRGGFAGVTFDLPAHEIAQIAGIVATPDGKQKITSLQAACTAVDSAGCAAGDETLCLLDDNRFKVEVDWRTSSNSGPGQVISSGFDSGLFYFFNPSSTDLLVQLLDACKDNDHFWVFYTSSINVEYDLTVTDTATGASRVYQNELGQAAQAVVDTAAFATCP